MKKTQILTALFCLLITAGAAFAQQKDAAQAKTVNFSGFWEYGADKAKTTDGKPGSVVVMKITQNANELKVERTTKRLPGAEMPIKGIETVNGGGMNGARSMAVMDTTETSTYSLNGKETRIGTPGIPGADVLLTATMGKDGKLVISTTRAAAGQKGAAKAASKETWELIDGGKALKITRDASNSNELMPAEMIFIKKQ